MLLHTFSTFDQKANAFLPPFFMPNVAMAERAFADCINDTKHQFGAHPEDYTLHQIATFDDENGVIKPLATPKAIGTGLQYVREVKPTPEIDKKLLQIQNSMTG